MSKIAPESREKPETTATKQKRARLAQSDVPSVTLRQALRVPQALRDAYAKKAATPLQVGRAMEMTHTAGPFRALTGGAVAYGLTEGAAQADTIALTPLGRRAVAPTTEGDDALALAEAVLKPRVIREFLEKYDQNRLPKQAIAYNVLEEMGVPIDATERALEMILENARFVGYVVENQGNEYVDLSASAGGSLAVEDDKGEPDNESDSDTAGVKQRDDVDCPPTTKVTPAGPVKVETIVNNKVFVTHGKNVEVVEQIAELLKFGGFEPVVSIQKESLAKSLPDKVMDDMRSCSAAVVHVGPEKILLDGEDKEHKVLNPNVLIEIGAALALYGKKFILLVEEGTELPSNLQGLYQARYSGGKLDYEATMKLLKTFNEFKS
ncbi:hypothetical protein MNAB215_4290 [Mycobacterium numidiamassiliense]|uniref:CD-NTase-associated protein 12/Pycsar effector protein TIR domain-containing protein n=1 Tax=Mycobacterium numidiamassiliense TaxID=1841861 RepID=A0A2U3PE94_9MYCO|nr:TIR domain-containing protein [Mycobacterium numidiamassiliense]SPM42072.1 hypothetical protein MNAB215_4290 [Mycobacterium numidiamassiliense]